MRFKYFIDSHLFGEVKDKLINNETKFQLEYLHEMDTIGSVGQYFIRTVLLLFNVRFVVLLY